MSGLSIRAGYVLKGTMLRKLWPAEVNRRCCQPVVFSGREMKRSQIGQQNGGPAKKAKPRTTVRSKNAKSSKSTQKCHGSEKFLFVFVRNL